jgi:hypothetical protein
MRSAFFRPSLFLGPIDTVSSWRRPKSLVIMIICYHTPSPSLTRPSLTQPCAVSSMTPCPTYLPIVIETLRRRHFVFAHPPIKSRAKKEKKSGVFTCSPRSLLHIQPSAYRLNSSAVSFASLQSSLGLAPKTAASRARTSQLLTRPLLILRRG